MTLAEFLLAGVAQDEESAYRYRETKPEPGKEFSWTLWPDEQEVHLAFVDGTRRGMSWSEFVDQHMERFLASPRQLAECEAKRQIVELHTPLEGEDCDPSCGDVPTPCATLRHLAAVYADHPDYRAEWT